MKIYSALRIGEYHVNHCEDYLFVGDIGEDKILCTVMDGCTMGIDSYFVSTLVGKLLRKISIEKGYEELYQADVIPNNLEKLLKSILKELFIELTITKNQLLLERNEMLTTLLILLADKRSKKGLVLVIGDGLVNINGKITEYDQDNKPDYLGFHLSEDFETWYTNQSQKLFIENLQDISIATDGIFMFKQIKKVETLETVNVLEYLVHDNSENDKFEMLDVKLHKLEHDFGLKPTDDLAIIRIING
jgi:hypothetical protein